MVNGKYRIAIASTDGIVVNQHFGRADKFIIADVDENSKINIVEQRFCTPVCEMGSHDENRLEKNIGKLLDCDYILVSKIGPGASHALGQAGVGSYEIPGIIEESVAKLLSYIELQKLLK